MKGGHVTAARIRVAAVTDDGALQTLLLRIADEPLEQIDDEEIERSCTE